MGGILCVVVCGRTVQYSVVQGASVQQGVVAAKGGEGARLAVLRCKDVEPTDPSGFHLLLTALR